MTQTSTLSVFGQMRALFVLGYPLVLGHLAQIAINVTDTLMLGWYGVTELAAVTLASSFWFVIFITGSGFAFAVTPLVAERIDSADAQTMRRIPRMGMWISALYFLAIVPLLYFSGPIFLSIGQDPDVADLAQTYLRFMGWNMLFALMIMVLKSHFAALEHTKITLFATLGAVVINFIVNYALIFGNWGAPELGIKGAAIASVASVLVSLVVLVIYALKVFPEQDLFRRMWRFDKDAAQAVFKLGWPIGLTNLAETGAFTAVAIMMGWLGAIELAAHGVALQIAATTFMIQVGISNATTIRAGRAYGKHDPEALKSIGYGALGLSICVASFTTLLFFSQGEVLVGAFLDKTDPDFDIILKTGVILLYMAAIFQLADGIQVIALGALRGIQDTTIPMIYAALSYWGLGMVASYVLGFVFNWGGIGVWSGLIIGLAGAGLLMTLRYFRRLRLLT